jgi:AbrB family looped-hinge helix DNA binding protein
MRITSKGQVTIPQELRRHLGLGAGTEVEVVAADDGALVRAVRQRSRGEALVAALRDRADGGLSADEVLRLTRGGE